MNSTTFVCLKGLRFHAPVGVLDLEKIVGNDILVDLKIGYPFSRAMKSDDVADTLNYAEVYTAVREEVAEPVNLLERLAGKIADRLLSDFPLITSIDMRITKENPPMGLDGAGAIIEIHLINPKTGE